MNNKLCFVNDHRVKDHRVSSECKGRGSKGHAGEGLERHGSHVNLNFATGEEVLREVTHRVFIRLSSPVERNIVLVEHGHGITFINAEVVAVEVVCLPFGHVHSPVRV